MINLNKNLMKEINLNNLRRTIKLEKKASKPELASLTGLSVVTVNSLIEILVKNEEVFISDEEISKGGRPASIYKFNELHSLALIVYCGEENKKDIVTVEVLNLYGESIFKEKNEFSEIYEETFHKKIEEILAIYPEVKSITIGLPTYENNGVINVSDYKNLEGVSFLENLRKKFNLPVNLENDINVATFGYAIKNSLEEKTIVGVYIPEKYPLGAGLFINGDIYKGKNSFAGEVSFLKENIKWRDPKFISNNINEAIESLIRTLTCVLNPDLIVIYRENLNVEDIRENIRNLENELGKEIIPEVKISNNYINDFKIGIAEKGLNVLENSF